MRLHSTNTVHWNSENAVGLSKAVSVPERRQVSDGRFELPIGDETSNIGRSAREAGLGAVRERVTCWKSVSVIDAAARLEHGQMLVRQWRSESRSGHAMPSGPTQKALNRENIPLSVCRYF